MCYIDATTGKTICYQNTFWSVAKDMFSSGTGLIMIFVPLTILIGGFFVSKYLVKSSKKRSNNLLNNCIDNLYPAIISV